MADQSNEQLWQRFADQYQLTSEQLQQYQRYYAMLMAANKEYDLTAITDFESILAYHFADSLEIGNCLKPLHPSTYAEATVDKSTCSGCQCNWRLSSSSIVSEQEPARGECPAELQAKTDVSNHAGIEQMHAIADVGTGAGFPGLALKIKYPHLQVILIEVLQKRINFLQSVIDDLQLTNISIYSHDWRTFLRKTDYKLDLICSRASLHPAELLRMFQPSSPYKNALLAYWASIEWQPEGKEAAHILKTCEYHVKDRTRKYVIFKT